MAKFFVLFMDLIFAYTFVCSPQHTGWSVPAFTMDRAWTGPPKLRQKRIVIWN